MSEKAKEESLERELRDRMEEIERCQRDRGLESCLPCPTVLECDIRKRYVDSVYTSMNRGESGGFEF